MPGVGIGLSSDYGLGVPYIKQLLATGPVGLWIGNEASGTDILDYSGNGHDGVANGDVSGWTPRAEIFGYSLPYYNNTEEVDLMPVGETFSASFDPDTLSMMCMLLIDHDLFGGSRYGMGMGADADNYVHLGYNDTSGIVVGRYRAGAVTKSLNHSTATAQWLRCLITVDTGADEFKFYVGAQQVDITESGLGVWAGSLASAYLGAAWNGLAGWVGNVGLGAYWNKVLSDGERAAVLSVGGDLYDPSA